MLFWIALTIVLVGSIYYAIVERSWFVLLMGFIFGPVVLSASAMVICLGVQAVAPYEEAKYGIHLEPLPNKDGTPSAFYLGSGEYGSNGVYSYHYGDNKFGYHTQRASEDYSTVHQTASRASARVIVTDYSGYNWFISPFHSRVKDTTKFEFYVPVGSVSGSLTVDSK